MVDRISALAEQYQPGKSGLLGDGDSAGVILQEISSITLYQLAAWPQSVEAVATMVANTIGAEQAPGPGNAQSGKHGSALRVPCSIYPIHVRRSVLPALKPLHF